MSANTNANTTATPAAQANQSLLNRIFHRGSKDATTATPSDTTTHNTTLHPEINPSLRRPSTQEDMNAYTHLMTKAAMLSTEEFAEYLAQYKRVAETEERKSTPKEFLARDAETGKLAVYPSIYDFVGGEIASEEK